MTLEQVTSLIFAFGTLATGLGTILNYIQSRQNSVTLDIVHKATNGMKDALVASTAKASRGEGEAQGRADEKREQADRDR